MHAEFVSHDSASKYMTTKLLQKNKVLLLA